MSKAVHDMFESIAPSYDLGNDVLSGGVHRWWRKYAISQAKVPTHLPIQALDLCCGTGDFCFAIQSAVHPESKIVGLDFVYPMLDIAADKRDSKSPNSNISFMHGDACSLPYDDNTFDLCTVGFGIRNVDSVETCLREMKRVLKQGGKAIILEFGQPHNPIIASPFKWYSKHIMPWIGEKISGNRDAYEYLPETSAAFPCRGDFVRLMESEGFTSAKYKSLFGGVAYCYIGTV